MKRLYLISGLGADERVFRNIDFDGNDTKFISWISPETNEERSIYCKRLKGIYNV